jgi:hypothetical protein
MRTDQLIEQLALDREPSVRPRLRLAFALAMGWLVALAALVVVLGSPLTMVEHTGAAPFAVKFGYALALTALSVAAAFAAGHPGRELTRPVAIVLLPIAVISGVAMIELASTDRSAWQGLFFGTTYANCILSVALASVPVLVAIFWAYRQLAPTHLALSGFLIGLGSGAAGAVAFAFFCHETSAAFLLAAYTPAMLIPAVAGALLSRPLLRW